MTRVVNCWGAPGSGKSTFAAALYSAAKRAGLSVELVTEFAKDLVWAERFGEMRDQLFMTATQNHRIDVLRGKVEWIVTDSPVAQGALYCGDDETLRRFIVERFRPASEDLNLLLPAGRFPFERNGRTQTPEEAAALEAPLRALISAVRVNPIEMGIPSAPTLDEIVEFMRAGRC